MQWVNNNRTGLTAVDFCKILLILIYLALDYSAVLSRFAMLGLSPLLAVFLVLYGTLTLALLATAFIPQHGGRLIMAALFSCASITLYAYEWSAASAFDYVSFEMMLASRGDAGDAAVQHGGSLLQAIAATIPLFLGLALPPRMKGLRLKLHWLLPLSGLLGLSLLLYIRGGEGARGLPSAFAPLAYVGIKAAVTLSEEAVSRQPVEFKKPARAPGHDIVLIVDESVSPTYLDINDPGGVYSGLNVARPGSDIINYGIAAAITNCSAGSNLSLRYGGDRQSYFRLYKSHPSIWAYARAAGLRAVYLDGQRSGGKLQNMATLSERAEIDDFVQLDRVPVVERDQRLARLLAERIDNGVAEFIYVNKVGAHFPVADKFPDAQAQYRPLPPRGGTANIIDMGSSHGRHKGTTDEWRLYRNAYRNTLTWNVGAFFDHLFASSRVTDAVIIYTSDHGQDLHESGQPGKTTHCITYPRAEEGAVPLVVIDRQAGGRLPWRSHLATTRHGQSHFRIFPTLLALMGYEAAEVEPVYGPTLTASSKDAMTFTPDYFPLLGREPRWQAIEIDRLSLPPRSDHASSAASTALR